MEFMELVRQRKNSAKKETTTMLNTRMPNEKNNRLAIVFISNNILGFKSKSTKILQPQPGDDIMNSLCLCYGFRRVNSSFIVLGIKIKVPGLKFLVQNLKLTVQ
jgi:hypothetical protein